MTASSTPPGPPGFGDRVADLVAARESQIVLGLDPDPARLWVRGLEAAATDGDGPGRAAAAVLAVCGPPSAPQVRAAAAVAAHCVAVIEAVAPAVVAVKPQLACFERLGAPGRAALGAACSAARSAGLLVLADGKRGDIDVSATAYAQSLVGETPTPWGPIVGLGADAMTAAPYMGADTLRSLLEVCRPQAAGVFVLVRTSNPGAADVEDAALAAGGTVWEHVARIVAALGAELGAGSRSGLADVGAVVGATAPEHVARMRELMPAAVFLLPGVGAQGGRVEDLAPAFAPGRAGGLVTASRSIVDAAARSGRPAAEAADAALAEAERLRAAAWVLYP